MKYIRKPSPPQGGGAQEAWLRTLLEGVSQFEITSIVGGKKKANPSGGFALVIDSSSGNGGDFPFRIYQGSTWLKYKVATGWVALSSTPFEPSNPDTELTVTSAVAKYYVYLDIGTSAAEFKVSSTALSWSTQLVLIGWIDTNTYSAETRGVITQFRKEHIQTCAA